MTPSTPEEVNLATHETDTPDNRMIELETHWDDGEINEIFHNANARFLREIEESESWRSDVL